MANDGDNNIIATPHILALDNQDATISIGQNIPLQQNVGGGLGALAGAAGAAGGAAGGLGGLPLGLLGGGFSAPRQDVGTKIKVKPHVNDSDQIRLELSEEISEAGAAVGALGAIPINKRTAETQLVVRDQQTVVIGGLVRDVVINQETKIPVLGDIPILGYLFKQSVKTKQKQNLLLVLTPYVIRSPEDLRAIFEKKMQERQEFIDRYFVFNEGASWSPPKDYRRANGLVEAIRQEIMQQEEKARIEAEAVRAPPKVHIPGQPIPLPAVGAGHHGAAAEEPAPAGAAGAPAAAPAQGGRPRPARPGGGGTPSPRVIERRE
jgi:general secretion pathway protein D